MMSDTFTSNSTTYLGGGGLYNDGTATSTSDVFTNNYGNEYGGGVYNNAGTLTATNDIFTSNSVGNGPGGGIDNNGMVTATDDVFTNNSAGGGGGLANYGAAIVANDVFAGNSNATVGGGMYNRGTTTATDDTFYNNSAYAGGGIYNDGTETLVNDTITDNNDSFRFGAGGLVNGSGSTSLYNTIVAGNYFTGSSYLASPRDIRGGVSGDNNLVGDPIGAGGLTDGVDGNIVGDDNGNPIDITTLFATTMMSGNPVPVFANYGGTTETVALIPGSPAIDAGSTSVPDYATIDQRGLSRVGAPDIGAFESQGFTITVSSGSAQNTAVGTAFRSR